MHFLDAEMFVLEYGKGLAHSLARSPFGTERAAIGDRSVIAAMGLSSFSSSSDDEFEWEWAGFRDLFHLRTRKC